MIPNAEVAFYTRAQNSVAGDYYDAFYPTDDAAAGGQLMLVMADVAGKKVSPPLSSWPHSKPGLRTIASEGLPLSELAIRLNHYACAHSLGGQRFTTAVLAEYDPTTRRLAYGQRKGTTPPSFVARILPPSASNPAASPSASRLKPHFRPPKSFSKRGDTLVLFTDGVVEAFNSAGEEFSDNRWLNIIRGLPNLNAQQTLQFLMKSVEDFVGATRQSDDITCLVLRCI